MKILFLCGDKIYKYMMKSLSKEHLVFYVGFNTLDENLYLQEKHLETLNLSNYDVILFPISGITDNMEIKNENR